MPRNKQETNTKAKRRAHNEGSIYYRADVKLWYGKVLTGRKADGSPQYTYVKAKKQEDVRTKVNALVRDVGLNGLPIATSCANANFGQMFCDWYGVFKADSVTDVTNEKNMGLMRLHIVPALGKYDITDIDTVRVQRFINSMKKQKLEGGFGYSNDSKCGYSSDYIRKARSLLDQFFKYALRKSLVTVNPVLDAKVGVVVSAENMDPDDEGKALTPELRVAVFQAVENHAVLKPILLTLAMQGLRTQDGHVKSKTKKSVLPPPLMN